jgi:hypothetical protein
MGVDIAGFVEVRDGLDDHARDLTAAGTIQKGERRILAVMLERGKIFATAQAVFECKCHCKVCKGET